MSSYYGGRAEVKIRREVVQVLYCDFLSMYPTVCTLMDLWKFNIAEYMEQDDVTPYVSELLGNLKIDDVRKPEFWKELNVLVQILPEDDILPVRARYARPPSNQRSIGINYLINHKPMWFTLADCIASTLLSGRSPKVIKAISFVPVGIQSYLKPITLAGKRIDPKSDDFYKLLIDRRNALKVQMKASSGSTRAKLDADQTASKICANATSYGIQTIKRGSLIGQFAIFN
jgi:DNA polymerase elongation subunit (family B)